MNDLPRPPAWMADAACTTAQVNFFPSRGRYQHAVYAAARAICDTCPVRTKCLAYALEVEGRDLVTHRSGMYGGLTPTERAAIGRRGAA